jgi:hypothetical protein
MKGTKLLKVAFSHIAYWKNEEISMGRPTFWPHYGLQKDDIVTWTGGRAAWHEVNALQVLHPHQGLIWVQEAYLDSF